MALPLTETDKFLLLHALGAPETRDRVSALLDLAGTGNMTGPASATDNALVRFDGTTGALVQNSGVVLSDAGALSGLTGYSQSSGQILGPDGTVSLPGMSFSSDSDNGFYRVGANSLGLAIGGAQTMQFNPAFTYAAVQLQGADGSVNFPQYSFNSDADTGLFRSGSGEISFVSNGVTIARLALDSYVVAPTANKFLIKSLNANASGLQIYANTATDVASIINFYSANLELGTANTVYQSISSAGAITLGASGGTQEHRINTDTATSATAGANGDVPAQVVGYIKLNINGTSYRVPYYAA